MSEKKKLRSYEWFGKNDEMGFVHRSWLRNQGYPGLRQKGAKCTLITSSGQIVVPTLISLRGVGGGGVP